jgi:hypothetical protein
MQKHIINYRDVIRYGEIVDPTSSTIGETLLQTPQSRRHSLTGIIFGIGRHMAATTKRLMIVGQLQDPR